MFAKCWRGVRLPTPNRSQIVTQLNHGRDMTANVQFRSGIGFQSVESNSGATNFATKPRAFRAVLMRVH